MVSALDKGAFFHHFKTKEALGVAAANHWTETTGALFAGAPYHVLDNPLDRVLAYLDFRKSIIGGKTFEYTCLVGTMTQEVHDSAPAIRDACAESIFGHAATLEADISSAMRARGIAAEWAAESLARHTQAVLQGAFILAKASGDPDMARESIDHLIRYIELLFDQPRIEAPIRKGDAPMTNREGTPIWYELMTHDPDAAQKFYKRVMGWKFEAMPGGPEVDYRMASAKNGTVAGLMRTPEHAHAMQNMWFVYFGVDDVDASAERVKSLGGRIDIEPTDIPGVGRFAFCSDPQGANFYLMRGRSDEDSTAFAPMKHGHGCWNELVTSDQKSALYFYSKLFGWEHGGAMPMGPAGDYTFINHNGGMIGAVMDAPEKDAKSFWNFAMQVADIDKAKAAVEKAGGTIRMGPTELPDNSGWLIQTEDPQGAKIMFVGERK